jgi:hypothetical protein
MSFAEKKESPMKTLMMAFMLISGPAMASTSSDLARHNSPDDYKVDYISWCEKNNVMAQDEKGQVYVRANCSDAGLLCKTVESYHNFGQVVTATCQPAQ